MQKLSNLSRAKDLRTLANGRLVEVLKQILSGFELQNSDVLRGVYFQISWSFDNLAGIHLGDMLG